MKNLRYLGLAAIWVLNSGWALNIPYNVKCHDSFGLVEIDSLQKEIVTVGDQQFFYRDIHVDLTDQKSLSVQIICPSCHEEIFSALARIKRLDGQAIGPTPMTKPAPDGALEAVVICYQNTTIYPPPPQTATELQ